jgi:uncharacterized metal-binding protein
MSDGKTHEGDSIALSIAIGIIASLYMKSIVAGGWMALGALCGVYLTPDLDVDGWIRSKRKVVNSFGLFGYLWFGYWYPYSRAIRHRHWISHMPVVGTAIRVLYVGIIPAIVATAVGVQLSDDLIIGLMLWFIGLVISDTAHWLRDFLR